MSYSGLIYAAIVACWAAVLVPRWIRRNEEVERAREEDAARGVRVLERRQAHAQHGSRGLALSAPGPAPVTASLMPDETQHASPQADDVHTPDQISSAGHEARDEDAADLLELDLPAFGAPARRRRRVLGLLVLALAVVSLAVGAGRLPSISIAVPAVLLAGFFVVARRAAVAQARRRARMRRVLARRRALARAQADAQSAAAAFSPSGKRVAVLDEPQPAEPVDPNAWEPVPVPLPTYLTKAKADSPVVRKIDLTSPGAWTSGRLNPAGPIALPPLQPAEDDDLPEQRRAVGG